MLQTVRKEQQHLNYKDIIRKSKETGIPFSKLYMDMNRPLAIKIAKKLPLLWKALMGKKYLLPANRQNDYYSAEICNHITIDFLMQISEEDIPKPNGKEIDEVLNTKYLSILRSLDCGNPVFYLEKELAPAILKTKLPDDFVVDDIMWRFPSFRVYLPKGCLSIIRDGNPINLMYIDVVQVEKEVPYRLAEKYRNELLAWSGGVRFMVPPLANLYTGMGVSGSLDVDSRESAVSYASTTPLKLTTIKELFDREKYHHLQAQLECDVLDDMLIKDMLRLAVNMLLFLSTPMFVDVNDEEQVIRKPKQEGERLISGLYPAKFIGQSQLKIGKQYVKGDPTGKHVKGHWTSGHWQRIAYGPKHSLRRLQWIGLYWSGEGD